MRTIIPQDATVIDASDLVAGRMATVLAEKLLNGNRIVVINAEKAVLSGTKSRKLQEIKDYMKIVGVANPKYGPRHQHMPDAILRRIIRGMLPMDKAKGREAFRKLKVYVGSPSEVCGKQIQTINEASALKLRSGFVSLGKIAEEIGWRRKQ